MPRTGALYSFLPFWLSPGNGGASQISILDAQLARSEGNCTRVKQDEDALTGLGLGACLERGGIALGSQWQTFREAELGNLLAVFIPLLRWTICYGSIKVFFNF